MRSRSAVGSSLPAAIRTLALTLLATVGFSLALQASAQSPQHAAPPIPARIVAMANLRPHANATQPTVATPVLSLAQGAYSGPQTVTITDATPGVTMYYTTNGAMPSTSSAQYSSAITIPKSGTLVALAVLSGYQSSLSWASYVITAVPDSFVFTVAGSGLAGYSGDGGPATEALLNLPAGSATVGTAIDRSGNLYIADAGNNRVRKVDASTGIITTIAGTGIAGYSGDGGPATSAQLSAPNSLAFDSSGNLYISEESNNDVRKVTISTGVISTYAGSQSASTRGDGGPAASAWVYQPLAIAFDGSDNLYILGSFNTVREVDGRTFIINTVAGGGSTNPVNGGGLPATSVSLGDPLDIAVDSAGDIFIDDAFFEVIWKVTQSTGNLSLYAGTLNDYGYSGDGGPATSATMYGPNAIALDNQGNLYISDFANYVLRRVDATTGIISTAAGNGSACLTYAEGESSSSTELCEPAGLAFDTNGNLYFANAQRIKKLTAISTPPSTATADPVFSAPAGTYATPQTLTITDATPGASIYISIVANPPSLFAVNEDSVIPDNDANYHGPIEINATATVVAVALAPGHTPSATVSSAYTITLPPQTLIETVAGGNNRGFSGAGGPATAAELGGPSALAKDPSGNLYISDPSNDVVWKVDANSGIISIAAGTGTFGYNGDNIPATKAELANPNGLAVDETGNLFIADYYNDEIREVLASNGNIIDYAGSATNDGSPSGDGGPATAAVVPYPEALAFDSMGNLFISDISSVRVVNATTGVIETIAGGSQYYTLGDGGPATQASLSEVNGLALDSSGNLYISDTYYGRVREVNAETGIINTIAGNGDIGMSGDGLLATQAEVDPFGLAVDSGGNIFFAAGTELRRIDAKSGIITAFSGDGYYGYSGDGGSASMAIGCPQSGLLLDAQANMYFSDACGNTVRKITSNIPAPAPTFSPAAGTYTGPQSITISDTAPNATIYYTTDGSTPTTSSAQYNGSITVPVGTETINAIAVASGYGQSSVGSAAYTITQATPTLTWAAPAAITYGTPLSSTQLDATASVAGTFAYSPAAGTVLGAGSQKLSVTFTPTDTADYTTATGSVTLTVNPAAPAIALASSTNPSVSAQSVTFTATVTSTAGSPTGAVTFFDGTTSLGSGTLTNGAATYTITTLAAGSHSITAQYSGDADFAPVTSIALAQTVTAFSIGAASGAPTTATAGAGGLAIYLLTVTPPGSSAVTFSVAGLPAGFSASFSPSSVPAGAGPTQVDLTVNIPSAQASSSPAPSRPESSRLPVSFGLLLLPLLGLGRSRRARRYLAITMLVGIGLAATAGLSGCSHNFKGSSGSGSNPPPPGTYALTVTATAGAQTQSTNLTLIVQ